MATRKVQQTRQVVPDNGGLSTNMEVRVIAVTDDSLVFLGGAVVDPDTPESDWSQAPYTTNDFQPPV